MEGHTYVILEDRGSTLLNKFVGVMEPVTVIHNYTMLAIKRSEHFPLWREELEGEYIVYNFSNRIRSIYVTEDLVKSNEKSFAKGKLEHFKFLREYISEINEDENRSHNTL